MVTLVVQGTIDAAWTRIISIATTRATLLLLLITSTTMGRGMGVRIAAATTIPKSIVALPQQPQAPHQLIVRIRIRRSQTGIVVAATIHNSSTRAGRTTSTVSGNAII